LALQVIEAGQRLEHDLRSRPVRGDFMVQRLDRPQIAMHDRRADVGNDVVGHRNGGVAQQWNDGLEAAAGDEH